MQYFYLFETIMLLNHGGSTASVQQNVKDEAPLKKIYISQKKVVPKLAKGIKKTQKQEVIAKKSLSIREKGILFEELRLSQTIIGCEDAVYINEENTLVFAKHNNFF